MLADSSPTIGTATAKELQQRGCSVLRTTRLSGRANNPPTQNDSSLSDISSDSDCVMWNRSSALSARTVLLEVKNRFPQLDEAVFLFDTQYLAETFPAATQQNLLQIMDEHIKGWMLLVQESIDYLKKQKKGRLVFICIFPGKTGAVQNTAVAVAESAFVRLAEETAKLFTSLSNPELHTLLVKCDADELKEATDQTAQITWIADQLESAETGRNSVRWIKAGSRGFFGKF